MWSNPRTPCGSWPKHPSGDEAVARQLESVEQEPMMSQAQLPAEEILQFNCRKAQSSKPEDFSNHFVVARYLSSCHRTASDADY